MLGLMRWANLFYEPRNPDTNARTQCPSARCPRSPLAELAAAGLLRIRRPSGSRTRARSVDGSLPWVRRRRRGCEPRGARRMLQSLLAAHAGGAERRRSDGATFLHDLACAPIRCVRLRAAVAMRCRLPRAPMRSDKRRGAVGLLGDRRRADRCALAHTCDSGTACRLLWAATMGTRTSSSTS